MALGLEMKNYVPVLGGASIVVALQLWWRFNCGGAVITANTVRLGFIAKELALFELGSTLATAGTGKWLFLVCLSIGGSSI